jgi:hypothetical protein
MSQTRPSLEPLVLVLVDDVDVDELSAAGPLRRMTLRTRCPTAPTRS